MKKGLKKILAATTALALLLSMGTAAMAAEYSTETTYTEDGVSVVTRVIGATPEMEYTYLVSKTGTVAQDSDIVYIDQQKAASASFNFDFVTDVDNLNVASNVYSAVVQVGSNEATAPTVGSGNTIELVNKTVTYSAENGYVYVDEFGDDEASTFGDTINFKLIPAAGYKIAGMTIKKNGVDLAASVIDDSYSATVANNDEFEFIFAEIAETTDPVVTTVADVTGYDAVTESSVTFTPNKFTDDAEGTTRQVTYFGTVTGDAKEFGILVSKASFSLVEGAIDGAEEVMKYAAAGKSNAGNFAISLYETKAGDNFESLLAEDSLYVAVYAVDANDAISITAASALTLE